MLEGLTTAIIVDQERIGANPRSTVGTATDANAMLRILFSRIGEPYVGPPTAFSFNVPTRTASGVMKTDKRAGAEKTVVRNAVYQGGMCPRCEGMGAVNDIDLTAIYDETKSLSEGALTVPGYSMDGWYGRHLQRRRPADGQADRRSSPRRSSTRLLYGEPTKIKVEGINLTYEGIIPKIQKSMLSKDLEAMQPHVRRFVERAVTFTTCPDCDGTRLTKEALSSKINGQEHRRPVRDADQRPGRLGARPRRAVGGAAARRAAAPARLVRRDRPGLPLAGPAGGHAVRRRGAAHQDDPAPRLVADRRHLRLRRADDRPAPARHRADEQLLLQLRDKGNTVLVVEHKPETIAIADHVVDLGPGAGTGGRHGLLRGHASTGCGGATRPPAGTSTTGRRSRSRCATSSGALEVRGASTHNLQDVDVDIPLGVLCVLTGVAGSGKSSLIHGLGRRPRRRGGRSTRARSAGSRRSNPATYTGLLDPIRKAFAKANGVKPALFSSNSEGACPTCNGAGVIYTELGVMATVESHLRGVRGQALPGGGAGVHASAAGTSPRCWRCRSPRPQEFFGDGEAADAGRPQDPGPAGRRRARLPQPRPAADHAVRAASGSGSSWPPRWPRRATSTSSTSRPPACTSPTSSSCSACSTGSSTPASR